LLEKMVVLDMAEEMVVLEQILEMMMPLPLPLMSEEMVVLERISEMMSLPTHCVLDHCRIWILGGYSFMARLQAGTW
jgi:hypothetical protein